MSSGARFRCWKAADTRSSLQESALRFRVSTTCNTSALVCTRRAGLQRHQDFFRTKPHLSSGKQRPLSSRHHRDAHAITQKSLERHEGRFPVSKIGRKLCNTRLSHPIRYSKYLGYELFTRQILTGAGFHHSGKRPSCHLHCEPEHRSCQPSNR